jgi:hypothetical protein
MSMFPELLPPPVPPPLLIQAEKKGSRFLYTGSFLSSTVIDMALGRQESRYRARADAFFQWNRPILYRRTSLISATDTRT